MFIHAEERGTDTRYAKIMFIHAEERGTDTRYANIFRKHRYKGLLSFLFELTIN